MIIREAELTDAASVARVQIDSWRTTYVGIVPQDFLDSFSHERRTTEWQDRLANPQKSRVPRFYYVAQEDAGEIFGFAGAGPESSGNQVYTGELGAIYLLHAYQRRGVGRQLVAKVALKLQEQGHNSMLVWVIATNPYRSFYEALGGQPAGQKEVNLGGANLIEVAYGWPDLSRLINTLNSLR